MPHIISNSDSCDTAEGFVISSSDNYNTAQCTILPLLAVHCSGNNYNRTRGMMFPLSEGCQLAGRCVCLHYNETSPLINNECGQFLFSDNIAGSDVVRGINVSNCSLPFLGNKSQMVLNIFLIVFLYPGKKFVIWKSVPVFMSKKKKIL